MGIVMRTKGLALAHGEIQIGLSQPAGDILQRLGDGFNLRRKFVNIVQNHCCATADPGLHFFRVRSQSRRGPRCWRAIKVMGDNLAVQHGHERVWGPDRTHRHELRHLVKCHHRLDFGWITLDMDIGFAKIGFHKCLGIVRSQQCVEIVRCHGANPA